MAEVQRLIIDMRVEGDFERKMAAAKRIHRDFNQQATKTMGLTGKLGTKLRSPELRQGLLQGVGLSGGLIGFQLLGSAIGGTIDYMGDAVSAASDLEEAQSKVDAVFEGSAPTVRRWAATLDDSFGITERSALKAAGTIGNFLTALGQTEADAANMSRGIVELAGDLASFNNVARDDVLIALQAGLAGEAEPVRRLGIDISAARVEALLLAEGIEKVDGAHTQSEKTLGRYLAIMEDTEKAQGDAARTSDTLAGKQRELDKAVGELQTSIGSLIVGPATDFLGFLTDIIDLSPDVSERVSSINQRLGEMRRVAEDVADEAAPLEREWTPLTLMDIPPFARVGIYRDVGPELVEIANKMRLTREELRDLIFTNNDATGALEELRDGLVAVDAENAEMRQSMKAAGARSRILAHELQALGGAATESEEEVEDLTASIRAFRREASGEAQEARPIGKVTKELENRRKLRSKAAREGRVHAFFRHDEAIRALKDELKTRQEAVRSVQSFAQGRNKQRRILKSEQQDARGQINKTQDKMDELGETVARPRIALQGGEAALAQLIAIRSAVLSIPGYRDIDIVGTPRTGTIGGRNQPGRLHSGGVAPADRTSIVRSGEALLTPASDMRVEPLGRQSQVNFTPTLTIAATQVQDNTSKVVRTARFRANT